MKTSFITIRNIILALLAFNCFNMNATLHSNIEDENDAQNASVNVIAYFCKNDTLDYVYSLEETKIKGNDTTTTLVASRKFRVVVLDSIATGYKIQCTPLELDIDEYNIEEQNFNSESEKEVFLNRIQQIINQKTYKYPIVFITNEEGDIQHI